MIHGTGDRGSLVVGVSGGNNPGSEPDALIEPIVHPAFNAHRCAIGRVITRTAAKIKKQKPVPQ
jgi:hypothetical protein